MTPKKPKPVPAPAPVTPFLTCGDCDAKSPVGTFKCPKCGYIL